MKNRKTPTDGDIPCEAWRLLLAPLRASKTGGIGAPKTLPTAVGFQKAITNFLVAMRFHESAPKQFLQCRAWALDKQNDKAACARFRLVHGLPNFPKATYKHVLWAAEKESRIPDPPCSAFGCVRARCREEAFAVQLITSWRLRRSRISFSR